MIFKGLNCHLFIYENQTASIRTSGWQVLSGLTILDDHDFWCSADQGTKSMFYDWPYPTFLPTPLLWVVFKEMTDLHEIYEKMGQIHVSGQFSGDF